MKTIIEKSAFVLCLLTGLGLIFIGARFFISPVVAEHSFGIRVDTSGNFSFHFIKGARDIFSGLALVVLLLAREYRALGMVLLCALIVPATDLCIVLSSVDSPAGAFWPHLTAVVIALLLGVYYIGSKQRKNMADATA